MPFANIAGVVSRLPEHLGDRDGIGTKRDVVEEHTVSQRTLTCEQGSTTWTADRQTRDGVLKANAFRSQPIQMRRPGAFIASKAKRLRPPLVGQDDDDIRTSLSGVGRRSDHSHEQQQKRQMAPIPIALNQDCAPLSLLSTLLTLSSSVCARSVRVPSLIVVAILGAPISCTASWHRFIAANTSSHSPSMLVPLACSLGFRPPDESALSQA